MTADLIIVGAGVVGCALARELSRYEGSILVLDRGGDVASGASKANSGIVHAGFDAHPGTWKAKANVAGSKMYEAFCKEVGAPYSRPGALVLAFTEEERPTIQKLYDQGIENGVEGLSIIEKDQILALEPNTNPDVVCALWAQTSGLTSPYELTCCLADHAALNGAKFQLETTVTGFEQTGDGWTVHTDKGDYTCRVLVNCAGVSSAILHNTIRPDKPYTVIPRKGEYYLLDHMVDAPFTRTMFQCPSIMGKGILVSPTVHGNTLLGPSAIDLGEDERYDTATTANGLAGVFAAAKRTWPGANTRKNITTFAGIRAHEANGDFIVGAVEGVKNAYETVGIESPGLSAAPYLATTLAAQIAEEQNMTKKATFVAMPAAKKPFREMTNEERQAAYEENPEYGTLVCRCEQVTEAEIRAAIRRPVPATNIDAVKRRTRAGMGRCQGGFCSPRVLEILSEELGKDFTEITQHGGNSKILVGTITEAVKGEQK